MPACRGNTRAAQGRERGEGKGEGKGEERKGTGALAILTV